MERKRIIIKKESKIKKNEENRTEFSNVGLIRTTKSEMFSETSLIITETITNNNRASVDSENCSTKIINRELTESKRSLDVPSMRSKQKDDLTKPETLDNFSQTKDLGGLIDNKQSIAIDSFKDGNLNESNEVDNVSDCFKVNTSEKHDAENNVITEAKLDSNPLNEIQSNINEVCEKNILKKSSTNNQEKEESGSTNLPQDGERNVHNICNIPSQKSYKDALNLTSAGKVSNINTKYSNLRLRSPNLCQKFLQYAANNKNQNKKIKKGMKDNIFFKKDDIYKHGDNLISSRGKGRNNKAGVYMDKFNKSVTYLVNYFENMKNPVPKKTDLESFAFSSEIRKLSETAKRQKRKLTDDQSFPNKKIPLHDSLNSRLPTGNFNAEDCTSRKRFASKNIGLLKKSNEDNELYYECKTYPNFNFNDDSAEFCVIKCRQTQMGAKTQEKTLRQPRENRFAFLQSAGIQSEQVLCTPKTLNKRSPDLRKQTKDNFRQPDFLPDKLTKSKENNAIDDKSAIDVGKIATGGVELKLINDKAGYQLKNCLKSNIDDTKIQKSNFVLEKKICMNNPFHLKRHLNANMTSMKESAHKEEKGQSLKTDESSFVKCFSSLILFMVIFAFGSYYQFFE